MLNTSEDFSLVLVIASLTNTLKRRKKIPCTGLQIAHLSSGFLYNTELINRSSNSSLLMYQYGLKTFQHQILLASHLIQAKRKSSKVTMKQKYEACKYLTITPKCGCMEAISDYIPSSRIPLLIKLTPCKTCYISRLGFYPCLNFIPLESTPRTSFISNYSAFA